MKRGEVWTATGSGDYAGKPRPVVILQDDRFDSTGSVTVCPLTTNPVDAPLFRLLIQPSAQNGLKVASRLMADKITTVARIRLGLRIGRLTSADMAGLSRSIIMFLNLLDTLQGEHK
jgi:mRNA interferase MazF